MSISRVGHLNLALLKAISEPQNDAENLVNLIAKGQFNKVLTSPIIGSVLKDDKLNQCIEKYIADSNNDLDLFLVEFSQVISQSFLDSVGGDQDAAKSYLLLLSVTLLQLFIQWNFTGPFMEVDLGFLTKLSEKSSIFLNSLSSMGQIAYELVESPYLLVLSIKILELLNDSPVSFLNLTTDIVDTELVVANSNINTNLNKENDKDLFTASVQWWRSRAYQVQTSLLPEPSSILASISVMLLNSTVMTTMAFTLPEKLTKQLLLVYHLECARNGINTNTEHVSVTSLAKAKKVSGLNLVLTGCKAKRTKYQEKAHSSLVFLASNPTTVPEDFQDADVQGSSPESFALNSDLLLERPVYESYENDSELLQENDSKRIKLDLSNSSIGEDEDQDLKLLPIAIREEMIPDVLKQLDPNNQPKLTDLDVVQLLLRFVTLKQTSPSNSPLVEEELMALIQRILFTSDGSVNWSIFSKALWERSLLETNKAKTVERGVLQMQSIVEELGMSTLQNRLFAETEAEKNVETVDGYLPSSYRLKLIHQLPLTPKWTMDAALAEKYMSLGVLRSALEIYERLQLWNEAALCHAAVGNEKEAIQILEKRLASKPNDARSLSIMGDIKQDPNLWLKSWEIGKYPKAKNSLARYYYNPPKSSGLSRDLQAAIDHQFDSLSINPLSFESWYFYGCLGLEAGNYELASEAFTRCVSLDDQNAHAWSNLSSALVSLDKLKPAFNALQKAVRVGRELKSWRIWENYLLVAAKLMQWDDVLVASKQLLEITKDSKGENAIDIPVVEKLVEILLSEPYDEQRLSYFQSSCIEYVCVSLPQVIDTSARCWRIISKVELWRGRPWAALDVLEKLFRSLLNNPDLEFTQSVWDDAVESCSDLVAAYENYGELPGRHGGGDVVCKDWKYKAKSSVRSLMSRGRNSWSETEGYEKLQGLKEDLQS